MELSQCCPLLIPMRPEFLCIQQSWHIQLLSREPQAVSFCAVGFNWFITCFFRNTYSRKRKVFLSWYFNWTSNPLQWTYSIQGSEYLQQFLHVQPWRQFAEGKVQQNQWQRLWPLHWCFLVIPPQFPWQTIRGRQLQLLGFAPLICSACLYVCKN